MESQFIDLPKKVAIQKLQKQISDYLKKSEMSRKKRNYTSAGTFCLKGIKHKR